MQRTLLTRIVPTLLLALAVSGCSLLDKKDSPTEPDPNPTPTPNPNSNVVSYTAVGASDAIGYGSSVACLPFAACPDGKGYVQVFQRRLKSDGKTVSLQNLGLPGGVLSPEIQSIGNSIGRDLFTNFIDNEMNFVAKDATLVTVFAGGNDVNTIAAAIKAGAAGSDVNGYVTARRQAFGRDLRTLLNGIRARSASARIVWLNLPNLAALPYAAGYTSAEKKVVQQIAVAFSAEINALRADGVLVVDIMCDPFFYQSSGYSSDGFHPNDTGYQHMADVIYGPATTGQGSVPAASCSQMTLF